MCCVARKLKIQARFNFYVYALPFIVCLYFIHLRTYALTNDAIVEIKLLRSSKNLHPCARKNNAEVEIHAKAHTLCQKTSAWVLDMYNMVLCSHLA